ncbi:hypothetical protein ANCDUO_14996 [Ancylostoma duodenale]|uniref:Uncharacterized protein n=1 Tax=Ancylostoma duodenale TaxID=51022 RepID=A0A0C2G1Q4_9BILA|nr:hypothetical protein ANCDUO_14996 [Ancylostoma duodenale]
MYEMRNSCAAGPQGQSPRETKVDARTPIPLLEMSFSPRARVVICSPAGSLFLRENAASFGADLRKGSGSWAFLGSNFAAKR